MSSLTFEPPVEESRETAAFPGIPATADGSGAIVWVESHISQGACAYPITPSTPMGDGFATEFANGKKNLWGEPIQFLEPESEHSAASACEGFALAGGRVTNFTSGQGLLLMKEVLYVISGKRLPIVFHIGARALTSHSLNIHCGHDDVMGCSDIGWGMLFGRNAQETADLALISRRTAECSETPFLNIMDGFLTTHTLESVRLPEPELMADFVGEPKGRINKLFDPQNPLLSGPVQNQDSYMKGKIAQRFFYARVAPALTRAFREYSKLTGRKYDYIIPYRMEDAEFAFVGMGTMMETCEATVDHLRAQGMRIGCVSVTSFRPFPGRRLAEALQNCRIVTVIERVDTPLAESNALTLEIKAALNDAQSGLNGTTLEFIPRVYSGVAGLGGRDIRPGHFVAAAQNMAELRGRTAFVLGIKHPDALPVTADPDVRTAGSFSLRGHSVGGFGSVTTNKVLASVSSELFGMFAQAFPKYGSEKKGLPTSYYLTLSPEPVRLHCDITTVEYVTIQDQAAFLHSDPLAGLVDGGTVLFQSGLPADQVWHSLPKNARDQIRARNLQLYTLDALKIAHDSASRQDLRIRMQGIVLLGAFLRLTPFAEKAGLNEDELFTALRKPMEKYFGKRGEQVILDNLNAARRGFGEVIHITPPASDGLEVIQQQTMQPGCHMTCQKVNGYVPADFNENVIGSYATGRESDLEADEYVARSLMPPGSAMQRSFRNLAPDLPVLDASACVGCMECVNICPDTAILAKVAEPQVVEQMLGEIEDEDLRAKVRAQFAVTSKYHDIPVKKGQVGGLFGVFVDPEKCKGCGECVVACGSHLALKMQPKAEVGLEVADAAMGMFDKLPATPDRFINEKVLGDMMLASGKSLLFAGGAGSCMGCGEVSSIRLMLAATGFQYGPDKIGIVGATGCNSVYGATYPYNPFLVPWTNSLFENAPADAMGIYLRWAQDGHGDRRLWTIGGDGAMYDIGFQSLSRLLASGMDVKVLVLDTQVYSNTGGQSSTATFTGQEAKMAAFGKAQAGKRERRKELGAILMMHPDAYVAQTTPAHLNHFLKCIMEANAFPGPAVVIAYSTCQPEHGVPDDRSYTQSKLVVDSRTFPLFTYDPRRGESFRERLNLVGNPNMKEDWTKDPKTGEPIDFVAFARTEGRFGRHFKDGQPDEFLLGAQKDRLANWRRLQELAGFR